MADPHTPAREAENTLAEAREAKWGPRAQQLLEQALGEHRDGKCAIITASAAVAALRIAAGELPEDELASWFDEDGAECICPADLVARGGYKGGCPVHG